VLATRAWKEDFMLIELEREEDGRWIAEIPALPGAMAYGRSRSEALAKVEALVLRILADRLENGEDAPELDSVFTVAA
jgi:predicted RNase H-like HicB family nuclease